MLRELPRSRTPPVLLAEESKVEILRERSRTEFVPVGSTRGAGGVLRLLPRPVRRSRVETESVRVGVEVVRRERSVVGIVLREPVRGLGVELRERLEVVVRLPPMELVVMGREVIPVPAEGSEGELLRELLREGALWIDLELVRDDELEIELREELPTLRPTEERAPELDPEEVRPPRWARAAPSRVRPQARVRTKRKGSRSFKVRTSRRIGVGRGDPRASAVPGRLPPSRPETGPPGAPGPDLPGVRAHPGAARPGE